MPLYSFEITEMPQVILKYFKTAPAPIEITEMPLFILKYLAIVLTIPRLMALKLLKDRWFDSVLVRYSVHTFSCV